jgi:hypothetical protein
MSKKEPTPYPPFSRISFGPGEVYLERKNKNKSLRIALDFDGVIHEWKEGRMDVNRKYTKIPFNPPVEGAKDFFKWCNDNGHRLSIFSARADTEIGRTGIIEWLEHYQFELSNSYELEVTDVKPKADIYIDDRGYRFTGDFKAAMEFLEKGTEPWGHTNA